MNFKINNRNWKIIEAPEEVLLKELEEEHEAGASLLGLCVHNKQIIYINEASHINKKRQTLIHELMHCYIGSYLSHSKLSCDEEVICDLVGNSHDIINEIISKYFAK